MAWNKVARVGLYLVGAISFVLVLAVAALYWLARPALGGIPKPFSDSAQWHGDRFHNTQPMYSNSKELRRSLLDRSPLSSPNTPVPYVKTNARALQQRSALTVTWFGHSSTLVQMDGANILIDPVWSERVSPLSFVGPKRFFPAPIAITQLPPIDLVVISHDHYDHLDKATIQQLGASTTTRFVVPLGIGAHLRRWGISTSRIAELDWWTSTQVSGINVTATPARHHSGRLSPQSDRTLWAGYALAGSQHRVFYSGDTGMHDAFEQVGQRLGPFDLALIEVGQYNQAWPDWHIGPEQAVWASKLVKARIMFPVHYALFDLAPHAWTEPVERTLAAGECQNQVIVAPTPGMTVDFTRGYSLTPWWPHLAGRTAAQYPIVATHNGIATNRYAVPSCQGRTTAPQL